MRRWPGLDQEAIRESNRKQAVIPAGATVLDPVGTAPGLVVPPLGEARRRRSSCCPGLRASCSRCGRRPARPTRSRRRSRARPRTGARSSACSGFPSPKSPTRCAPPRQDGLKLDSLEITTCLRRGEIEVATRYEPPAQPDYDALLDFIRARHGSELFSQDGSTIDEQVAGLLADHTIAVAESCTGGLLAARLTDRAGSSAYFLGGGVVYSNEAKVDIAGVDPALIERHGAVSTEVAEALGRGIAARFGAEIGVGITGIAGPGGGTAEKPVGLVCISVCDRDGRRITRSTRMPGGRRDIRERSVTVSMHLLRRLLLGEHDEAPRDGVCRLGRRRTSGPAVNGLAGGERRAGAAVRRARAARRRPDRAAPVALRAHWPASPGCGLTAPEALHVTLCFLGSQPVERDRLRSPQACSASLAEPRASGPGARRAVVAAAAAPARGGDRARGSAAALSLSSSRGLRRRSRTAAGMSPSSATFART